MRKLKHGEQIPGSRFFRTYCPRCDEPMRVEEYRIDSYPLCEDCGGGKAVPGWKIGLTPRQRAKLGKIS